VAVLFMTGRKQHPEDVQPHVIVPYHNTHTTTAILDAVKLNLGVQGLRPRMVKLERDFSYDQLFRGLWAEGKPFIIVEHDIIPWPGAVQQLWACPEPWCGFPYHVFGELRSYLGCTKIDPTRLGECPMPEDLLSWQTMDSKIEETLVKRGFCGHLHSPAVSHLNFSHARQTGPTILHPQFWEGTEHAPDAHILAMAEAVLSDGSVGLINGKFCLGARLNSG